MFSFLKKFTKYVVVEIEKGEAKLPAMTADLKASIQTLQFHPGYQYLATKRRYFRAMLEKQLREGLDLPENAMRAMQAGLYWLRFEEDEARKAVMGVKQEMREAFDHEAEAFEKIKGEIELIS